MGKTNFKEKWKNIVERHGKNKVYGIGGALLLFIVLVIFGVCYGLTNAGNAEDSKKVNYLNYVTGIRDWKVEVDTEKDKVDFLTGVDWNEKYIKDVTVEDEEVKLDTVGEYTITYVIDVKESGIHDIEKEQTVEVISKEEAEKAETEGEEVATEEGIKNEKNEEELKKEQKTTSENKSSTTSSDQKSNTSSSSGSSTNESQSSSSGSSSNSKPSGSSESKPNHTHNWQPQYTTVHHDAVYEQKYVVDQAAWSEERTICNQCGADITGFAAQHILDNMPNCGGYHSEWINHPEQGHYENVQVSAAWDEQVLTGYKCSCGATKM